MKTFKRIIKTVLLANHIMVWREAYYQKKMFNELLISFDKQVKQDRLKQTNK